MPRRRGLSVRLKLTLSYAGIVVVSGLLLLGAVGNAIVTWTWHFTGALVRRPATARDTQHQVVRQILLNLGVLGVTAGVVGGQLRATVAGAAVVGCVLAWHGAALALRARGALSNRFRRTVTYYTAACLLLPVGAALGALLAGGRTDEWQSRLVLAHLALNLLGFVGLTILGTLVTLWPTMLRTALEEGSERTFAAVLPLLLLAVALTVTGALGGLTWIIAAGLLLYGTATVTLSPDELSTIAWALSSLVIERRGRGVGIPLDKPFPAPSAADECCDFHKAQYDDKRRQHTALSQQLKHTAELSDKMALLADQD